MAALIFWHQPFYINDRLQPFGRRTYLGATTVSIKSEFRKRSKPTTEAERPAGVRWVELGMGSLALPSSSNRWANIFGAVGSALFAWQCYLNLLPCLPSNPFSSPIQRDEFDPSCLDRLLNCFQGRGPGLSSFRLKILDGAQAHLGCLGQLALRDVEQPPRGAALTRRYVSLIG